MQGSLFNGEWGRGVRRGLLAVAAATALLFIGAVPSRLGIVLFGWGLPWLRALRGVAGAVFDLSAALPVLAPLVVVGTLMFPLVFARLRGARWQRAGALVPAAFGGALLWLATTIAQEVKQERGAFPTVFDLMEGGSNLTFIESVIGFIWYQRVFAPLLFGLLLAVALATLVIRRPSEEVKWRPWASGVVLGGVLMVLLVRGMAWAEDTLSRRFTSAAVGDPLTGMLESVWDVALRREPVTPRQLVQNAELEASLRAPGAALVGWPPEHCDGRHLYSRPLWDSDTASADSRGGKLLSALSAVSQALFDGVSDDVAVFFVSLEGFRSDDIRALNPEAPVEISPFISSLYEKNRASALTSARMYQAGVRTAHGLGAMLCGLGTLPYNLSLVRDLQPFAVRCVSDVLHDARLDTAFYYGSDATFDSMGAFMLEHGFNRVVSQAELPKNLPIGTWDAVTDMAVFDRMVADAAEGLRAGKGSQFFFAMSLSNHGPFTPPQDLPESVTRRVDEALKQAPNHADADDRKRLVTHSYTDAAVERLFERLEQEHIADRSIVIVLADHSTGHSWVWGPTEKDTDEARAGIPFAIVLPEALRARARDAEGLRAHLNEVQRIIDQAPLSQNDVPAMMLALLRYQRGVANLAADRQWHTLGGQVTSPYFHAPDGAPLIGINGVSQFFALDESGKRSGEYEESVFLKTRSDRYRVTPTLIPVTSVLQQVMAQPIGCASSGVPK